MKTYIRYMMAILRGHLTGRSRPIFVTLCVTNRCNLRCAYCYEEYYDRNYQEIPKERILQLIDELAEMGTPYISVNGGEALLREDLEEIVDRIKQKRMLCHLSTNGLLIPQRMSLLRKIDSIAISIDGIGESNDLNRGRHVYDKIIESMELLKKEKIRFHAHTVLTKNNKNAVDEMMQLAHQYGFEVQFSVLRKEDSPNKNIGLEDQELKEIIQKIIGYKKKGLPVFFSARAYENFLNWPFSYDQQILSGKSPQGYQPIPCHIKRFACHIEANGLVYPCIVLVNKFPAMNFLEVGFKKAWDHLSTNPCQACYNVCCNDHNLILGLNFSSLWNAVKIVLRRVAPPKKRRG